VAYSQVQHNVGPNSLKMANFFTSAVKHNLKPVVHFQTSCGSGIFRLHQQKQNKLCLGKFCARAEELCTN